MSDRKWPGSEEAKVEIRQKSKSSNCHFHHGMEPLFFRVVSFITDQSAADAAAKSCRCHSDRTWSVSSVVTERKSFRQSQSLRLVSRHQTSLTATISTTYCSNVLNEMFGWVTTIIKSSIYLAENISQYLSIRKPTLSEGRKTVDLRLESARDGGESNECDSQCAVCRLNQ